MAILKKLIPGCIVFFMSLSLLTAGQTSILIDKSGSMLGFFKTGALEEVYQSVSTELNGFPLFSGVNTYAFDTDGIERCERFSDIIPGGDTLIDVALKNALIENPDLVILVTDNIQDPGDDSADSDVRGFYMQLKAPLVGWVFIFPLQMPFNGWMYTHGQWQGTRAALMYAVLLQKPGISVQDQIDREEEYLKLVNRLESRLKSNGIRCKPLEKGVRMSIKEERKQKRGKVNITPGEIKIKFDEFNSNPRFSLKLVISSKYSNIAVSKAKIEGIKSENLDSMGLFKELNTSELVPMVIPDSIENLEPSTSQEHYRIDINMKGIKLNRSFGSLLKMPFNREGEIHGQIKLKIRIPKQELQLQPAILEKFSTDRRDDPEKIFALEQLVPVLAEGEEVEISDVKRFTIVMPYPGWPVIILLGIALLLGLLVLTAFQVYRSTANVFVLKINGEEQDRVRFMPMQWKTLYTREVGAVAKAQKKGDKIRITPGPGLTWPDMGESETRSFDVMDSISFSLSSRDGQTILLELLPMEKKKKEEAEVDYEDENEFFKD